MTTSRSTARTSASRSAGAWVRAASSEWTLSIAELGATCSARLLSGPSSAWVRRNEGHPKRRSRSFAPRADARFAQDDNVWLVLLEKKKQVPSLRAPTARFAQDDNVWLVL